MAFSAKGDDVGVQACFGEHLGGVAEYSRLALVLLADGVEYAPGRGQILLPQGFPGFFKGLGDAAEAVVVGCFPGFLLQFFQMHGQGGQGQGESFLGAFLELERTANLGLYFRHQLQLSQHIEKHHIQLEFGPPHDSRARGIVFKRSCRGLERFDGFKTPGIARSPGYVLFDRLGGDTAHEHLLL